jgi:hypothetical protein
MGDAGSAFVSTPALAQTRDPSRVVVPSESFRTIQQGIDAVAAGGTVHIKPGTYRETLIVAKEISLIGSGARGGDRTEIVGARPRTVVPADQATGIVTYVAGGGGEIKSLTVRGRPCRHSGRRDRSPRSGGPPGQGCGD